MLISHIEELTAIYPTSRWDNISDLLHLFSKVERSKLSKYLGLPLLTELNTEYKKLAAHPGGITFYIDSIQSDAAEEETVYNEQENKDVSSEIPEALTLDVLRACQEIIVYVTLSNNVRILSSSFNKGGGFNSMSTSDYDPSSDVQLKALSVELWRNAMDSLDSLLILLEQDAKENQVYTALWKQSVYYYRHSDLIFRTADELSHYINIEGGRATYIQLTPGLRNAQNQYITTHIGKTLTTMIVEDDCAEDSDIYPFFIELSTHIKQALANYANIELLHLRASSEKNSAQSKTRSELESTYHDSGDREMAMAIDVIVEHPREFKKYIDEHSTLQYEYTRNTKQTWQDYLKSLDKTDQPSDTKPPSNEGGILPDNAECSGHKTNPPTPYMDAICDLGGWHFT